jgi:hypothetical protein
MSVITSEIVLAMFFLNVHVSTMAEKMVDVKPLKLYRELIEVKDKVVSRRCYSI